MKIEFEKEKITKNTVKFSEVLEDDLTTAKIGAVYVQKAALKEIGWSGEKHLIVDLTVSE